MWPLLVILYFFKLWILLAIFDFQTEVQSLQMLQIARSVDVLRAASQLASFRGITTAPEKSRDSNDDSLWRLDEMPPPPTHSEKSLSWCGRREAWNNVKMKVYPCVSKSRGSPCWRDSDWSGRTKAAGKYPHFWHSASVSLILGEQSNTGASVNHVRDAIIFHIKNRIWGQMFCRSPCDCFLKIFSPLIALSQAG